MRRGGGGSEGGDEDVEWITKMGRREMLIKSKEREESKDGELRNTAEGRKVIENNEEN